MEDTPETKPPKWHSIAKSWGTTLALAGLFFLALQTLRVESGKQAFESTGLEKITIEEALVRSAEQNKPILINFSAYWCSSCKRFDKTILTSNTVKQVIEEKFVFARMEDGEVGTQEWMQFYQARGYPTLLLTDAEGNLIKRLSLTLNEEQFLQQLNTI